MRKAWTTAALVASLASPALAGVAEPLPIACGGSIGANAIVSYLDSEGHGFIGETFGGCSFDDLWGTNSGFDDVGDTTGATFAETTSDGFSVTARAEAELQLANGGAYGSAGADMYVSGELTVPAERPLLDVVVAVERTGSFSSTQAAVSLFDAGGSSVWSSGLLEAGAYHFRFSATPGAHELRMSATSRVDETGMGTTAVTARVEAPEPAGALLLAVGLLVLLPRALRVAR